jgi:hypothetical protein
MSGATITEVVKDKVYCLRNPLLLDGRLSAYPKRARGWSSSNCYVVKEPEGAYMLDTGYFAHQKSIITQLDQVLDRRTPLRLRQRSLRQTPKGPPLVQGDVLRLVALDLILRIFATRVMEVALVVHVLGVYAHDPAADPSGLRIPVFDRSHWVRAGRLRPRTSTLPLMPQRPKARSGIWRSRESRFRQSLRNAHL